MVFGAEEWLEFLFSVYVRLVPFYMATFRFLCALMRDVGVLETHSEQYRCNEKRNSSVDLFSQDCNTIRFYSSYRLQNYQLRVRRFYK